MASQIEEARISYKDKIRICHGLILRLSARLFVLLGLIGGVMSHLNFQYISIVAWSYICVYMPVFPVWRCKTLKSVW